MIAALMMSIAIKYIEEGDEESKQVVRILPVKSPNNCLLHLVYFVKSNQINKSNQIKSYQINSDQINQIKSAQIESSQVKSNQIKWHQIDQIKSSQWNQIKSNQIKSKQIKLGK